MAGTDKAVKPGSGRAKSAPRRRGLWLAGGAVLVVAGGLLLMRMGPQLGPYAITPAAQGAATGLEDLPTTAAIPERLTFLVEVRDRGGLGISVKGGGAAETIAEVRLDGVAVPFAVTPAGPIAPGADARVEIDRNAGVAAVRTVTLITTSGAQFSRQLSSVGLGTWRDADGAVPATR